MKRAIIIHCWEGYPEYCWYPWVKENLERKDFQVFVPKMPETEMPKLDKWLRATKEIVGKPDKNTYLIGHSLGNITIFRYLESLKNNEKIGGTVLVAGFTDNLGYKEISSFFKKPVDFKKIKNHCDKFIAIHSDNDPYVDLKYADIFKEKLGARIIIKHDKGHFSGPIENKKSCVELPDVVEAIIEITEQSIHRIKSGITVYHF